MTTNSAVDVMSTLAQEMVDAAVESVAAATGVSVAAGPPEVAGAFDPGVLSGAVAARSMLSGGTAPGGLITVVPAGGLPREGGDAIDAAVLIDALAVGAATAMSRTLGHSLQPAPAEALPADPGIGGLGTHFIGFDLGGGTGAPITITWIVEASLGAMVGGGTPVTPTSAAPSVAPAALPELRGGLATGQQRDLHLLADVPMNVTVELGRAVMPVRDLLSLEPGSIVELDRTAGATVDVLVNGTLVAKGEVVVVDDQLGVRISEIVEH